VAALLQLHQIAVQTGQLERASDLLERALYSFEQAYHPTFVQTWLRGAARLSYQLPQNQPFFRALHLHMVALGRRGCVHAALAAATLLLSLDHDDPTHALLWADVLALRAKDHQTLLSLNAVLSQRAARLPGWLLSLAFAKRAVEQQADATVAQQRVATANSSATQQLRETLLAFPQLLPAALQASGAANLAQTNLAARWGARLLTERTNSALEHLAVLYFERAHDLWSGAREVRWLMDEAEHCLKLLDAPEEGASARLLLEECTTRVHAWYPPGGVDYYRGVEFAALLSEQVVIPQEEEPEPNQPPPQPPPPPPEVAAAAHVEHLEGDDDFLSRLAALHVNTEAFDERVAEMERVLSQGAAPALRQVIVLRLKNLGEQLTQHHLAIDALMTDSVGDAAREALRQLSRRVDGLCMRVDALGAPE